MLPELVSWFHYWWDRLLHYHQVDPLVFIVMYVVKSIIYWWTVFLIVQRARRRQWDSVPPLILANIAVNVSPWMYVYFFGRNLPWWYDYMLWWLGGWAAVYLVWDLRRRLHRYSGEA